MRRIVTFAWIILGVLALMLEGLGLISNVDDIPPLTQIVTAYVPAVITLGFVGWLLVHFVQSYRDKRQEITYYDFARDEYLIGRIGRAPSLDERVGNMQVVSLHELVQEYEEKGK